MKRYQFTFLLTIFLSSAPFSATLAQSQVSEYFDFQPSVGNLFSSSEEISYSQNLETWQIHNTIIHFCAHIHNNFLMMQYILDNLLENGIPAQVIDHEYRDAVSAKELRRYYFIDEPFWHHSQKRAILREFMADYFLTKHDDAKLNMDTAFIQDNYRTAKNETGPQTYLINYLHRSFGTNPWKIPEDISDDERLTFLETQSAIRILNSIDTNQTMKFIVKRRKYSKDLAPPWIFKFILTLEKTVDGIEHWGNPISKLEFGRPMLPESKYMVSMGKIIERPKVDRHQGQDFPHRRLIEHLESHYGNITTSYDKYFQDVVLFYSQLKFMGVETSAMDPVEKYQILWLIQKGKKYPPRFSLSQLNKLVFIDHYESIRKLFLKNKKKELENFDYLSVKAKLTFYDAKELAPDLFLRLSLQRFLQLTTTLSPPEKNKITFFLLAQGFSLQIIQYLYALQSDITTFLSPNFLTTTRDRCVDTLKRFQL